MLQGKHLQSLKLTHDELAEFLVFSGRSCGIVYAVVPCIRICTKLGSIAGNCTRRFRSSIAGVAVIVTNQVTGKWKRARSGADGRYSFSLSAGAYRLRVGAPQAAKFDKDKSYGDFTIARGEALENVIIEPARTVIDIPLDQVEIKEISRAPADKPTGHAGAESVPSERRPIRIDGKRAIAGA